MDNDKTENPLLNGTLFGFMPRVDPMAAASAEYRIALREEEKARKAMVLAEKAYDKAFQRHFDAQARADEISEQILKLAAGDGEEE